MAKIRDEHWQRRKFFLSSFVRMNISLKSKVYEFVNNLILTDWKTSYDDLNDIDQEILKKYEDFINE